MTVESTTSRAQYATNGVTTVFAVPFYFLETSHLQVIYTDSTGNETTLVLTTNYSVSGAGDPNGGTITTVATYASGGFLTVLRDMPFLQETDYINNDAFPADSHERALDARVMEAQQLQEVVNRALVFAPSDAAGSSLPAVSVRADKLLSFDSLGRVQVVAPADGSAAALAIDLANSGSNTKGAAMVAYGQSNAYASGTVGARLREYASLTDIPFNGIADGATDASGALVAALQSGARRIEVHGTFALASPVTAVLANPVELVGTGGFVYTGANSTDCMITVQCAGHSLAVRGLTFDGDEKVAGGLRIENTAALSDASPTCEIERCSIIDIKMNTTSIWNLGLYVSGSFTHVDVLRNSVRNITRAAGTGTPGVNGTTGVYVTQYDAARYVRSCTHTGNVYSNISGGDLVASANNVDFDAFKFYAPDPTNNDNIDATVSSYLPATCWSSENTYKNVRGRAIKIQAVSHVSREKVIRDADYTIDGGSVEINLQYGAGAARDCEFFYKDYAGPTSPIQTAGHTLVSFFQGAWYDEANGGSSVSGIRVYNNIKAGTGSSISQIVNAQVGGTALGKDRPLIRVSDVVVNRGDVGWVIAIAGDTGADGVVVLEDISVAKLLYGAVGTGYANAGVKLIARGVYNLDGVNTPGNAKKFVTDTAGPGNDITFSGALSGHSCHGFLNTYNRGADFSAAPMLVNDALTGTGTGGAASVQTVSLADDASHTFERRFFNSARGLIFVSVNFDYTTQGVFACGSNGVYQIAAHASDLFTPSTTGTNTDTDGQLNLWFTGGALNIKNRLGGTYVVTVMFVG